MHAINVQPSRRSSESKRRCVSSHHISPPNSSLGHHQNILIGHVTQRSDVKPHPSQSNVALQTPASKTKNVKTTLSNGFNIHPKRTGTHQKVSGDVTHHRKSAPPNLSLSHPLIKQAVLHACHQRTTVKTQLRK